MQISSYLNHLLDVHSHICDRRGIRESRYRIGGRTVAVEIAGERINEGEITALEHLITDSLEAPSLRIKVFDPADADDGLPDFPQALSHGVIRMSDRAPWAQAPVYYHDNELVRLSWQESVHGYELNILHKEQDLAVVLCTRQPTHYGEAWIHASPFRTILSWWFSRHDFVMAHGASVGIRGGGVLLCGKGGSGKSTTALSCVGSGLLYAGDDSVLLTNGSPPVIHSMYHSAGLRERDAPKFPFLKRHKGPFRSFRSPKDLFLLAGGSGGPVVDQYPLRAVLALRLSDTCHSRLTPASWRTAITALAPSTLCQFSGDAQQRLDQLSRITAAVPTYTLDVGTDSRRIPEQISSLLENALSTNSN